MQVDASGWPYKMQVEQNPRLVSTCETVWPGLYSNVSILIIAKQFFEKLGNDYE